MLIIQSYRDHAVPNWIEQCMHSVATLAERKGYIYERYGDDQLLDTLPKAYRDKLSGRWPMLADLGRLKLAQQALDRGEKRVAWIDADVYITTPEFFTLPERLPHGYAFGREVWIENKRTIKRGVHNALCVFEQNNPFLTYYIHACERVITQHTGTQWAPQLLGPKFLKMQHNVIQFDVLDSIAMLSPAVVESLANGYSELWELQQAQQNHLIAGVNLCSSLVDSKRAERAIKYLRTLPSSQEQLPKHSKRTI